MDFLQLNYFRAVARHGNMSQAARELYITQPGLSRCISRLEDELGVPLFERRKGKIVLNTYGQLFLANVNLAFDQLEQGTEAVRRLYSKDQNILSIACSIEDFLVDRLKEFSPMYPEIGIRQFSCSISEIETQLLRQNLDFAICAHAIDNPRIKYDLLSNCPYVLICHRNNPLAGKSGVYLSDAMEQSFVCENARLNRRHLEKLCKRAGFVPRVSHEVENGYILFNLLEAETGVSLIPLAHFVKIYTHFPIHHLKLLPLLDADFPLAEIGVAYLPERTRTHSAAVFLSFLHRSSEQEAELMLKYLSKEQLELIAFSAPNQT